ncbi:MAG: cellulase family glycosylhydrolase, partial [Clostridia bacterium]|nr:cellulase family glycosylhydrolase [Clostridia bacterium]
MKANDVLFTSGKYFTGCNYWASHAGTNMWRDWRPEIVEDDLRRLAEYNVRVVRMFPNWRDFQPLRIHYGGGSYEREIRLGEDPLPFTEAGRAGVDIVMADRFAQFCDLAEKHGIKLIVGLVTGWMSGRMHMPEAFQGKGLLSDPLVIRWQIRFVRYMVRRFKDHPAIAAWDLGNECNCMQSISHDAAYLWASAITNTIRAEDKSHPVVSGMHGLNPTGTWSPEDQGEILDILCTHPYPLFTPHCDTEPLNEMKSILHSTAESVMYASLGGKPCFVEEAGTLGPMIADEDIAADYIRACLFSTWAHDLRGFVWWCANEQSELTHTPYDWDSVERELGLFRIDGSPKPVVGAMKEFADFADSFSAGITGADGECGNTLPTYLQDAVCILTMGQDLWATAYGAFILAK